MVLGIHCPLSEYVTTNLEFNDVEFKMFKVQTLTYIFL